MISETLNITGTSLQRPPSSSEQVDVGRRKAKDESATPESSPKKKDVQPEELLQKIKALTDNGSYSVRFENDKATHQLVVKIVDSTTNEVIRQVPAEELLGLRKALDEYQGNIVDTTS